MTEGHHDGCLELHEHLLATNGATDRARTVPQARAVTVKRWRGSRPASHMRRTGRVSTLRVVTQFLDQLPAWLIWVVMFTLGMTRSAGYYLVGRLSRGGNRSRWGQRVERIGSTFLPEAERRVAAVGPRAVTLAYPFYGLSGATQIVAGMTRMPVPGFVAAVGLGAALWSLMLAVVGVAAVEAVVAGWTPWVLLTLAVLSATWFLLRRVSRDPQPAA